MINSSMQTLKWRNVWLVLGYNFVDQDDNPEHQVAVERWHEKYNFLLQIPCQ